MLVFIFYVLETVIACDLCTTCSSTGCDRCTLYAELAQTSAFNCTCTTGYFRYSSSICSNCPSLCKECTSVVNCQSCVENSYLDQGGCYCNSYYYFNSTTLNCQLCPTTCSSCSNSTFCDSCIDNAEIVNSVCQCKSGLYYNKTTLACETCKSSCKECESVDVCTACYENENLIDGVCVCGEGYYEKDYNICNQCPSSCKTCNSSTICIECLLNNSYPDSTSSNARCACNTGYFLCDSECVSCHKTCKKCSSSVCQECIDDYAIPNYLLSDGSCICIDGYYLNESSCVPCDNSCQLCTKDSCTKCISPKATPINGICQCITGYYAEQAGVCKSCDVSCAQCNSAQCLQCYNDYSQLHGKFCKCPSSMFTTNSHRTCYQCHDSCEQCTSLVACSKCKDLHAKPANGICNCQSGYFMIDNACVACDSACKTCDLNSKCLTCIDDNAHVNSDGSSCECNDGFFYDRTCKFCDTSCNLCTASECIECKFNNSKVVGNKCECIDGFYFTNSGCEVCDEMCLTCNDSSCLTCIQNSVLVNGKCECNLNSRFTDGKCQCIDGFIGTNHCKACKKYVRNDDIGAYFSSDSFTLQINFSVRMNVNDNIKCKDAIREDSIDMIGTNPVCYWEDEFDFVIKLGNYANFTGDTIFLIPNSFVSNESECQEHAPTNMFAILGFASNNMILYDHPKFSIIGPDKVSRSCDSLTTYSCYTLKGSKNVKKIKWTSYYINPVSEIDSTAVFNLSSVAGDSIKIKVTLENLIGSDIVYYFTTKIVDNKLLQIKIRNGKYIMTRSWVNLIVIADITDTCGSAGTEVWTWSLISISPSLTNQNIAFDTKLNWFNILPNSLLCGYNYSFSVNVTKGDAFGEAIFFIYPECDELVIILSRGPGSISSLTTSVIDASQSFDPDNEKISFFWEVSNYTGSLSSTSSSIQLNPKFFKSDSIIELSLTIETANKYNWKSITLIPTNLDVNVNYLQSTQRVNLPLTYSVDFNDVVDCKFVWRDYSSKIVSKSSIIDIKFLILQQNYQFSLTCNSSVYTTQISINPNLPAECLEFSLSSYNITAYTEPLKVAAFKCFDGDESDYPLKYNYGINNSELSMDLITNSYTSFHNLTLFPGKFRVIFKVCDFLDMCTEYLSSSVKVNLENSAKASYVYDALHNNINEAIIVAAYNNTPNDTLMKIMWTDLSVFKVADKFDMHSYLSTILVLAQYKEFEFDLFIETLKNYSKKFDGKSLDLLCDIQNQLILTGTDIDNIFSLDEFILQALKTGKSDLKKQEKSEKKLKKIGYFKSVYTDTPIHPDYISNVPSPSNDEIINLQVVRYNNPPAISILFSTTGTYSKGKYKFKDEKEIHYNDIELYATFEVSNSSTAICVYKNETGNYTNDGCAIHSTNETHTIVKLTHTSFFFLSYETELLSYSSCSKSYIPIYILNFLIIACPLLIILFKALKKEDHSIEEIVEQKPEERDNEEEIKENSRLPVTTIAEESTGQKVSMFYFHLYVGIYLNGKTYLSSLKIFNILCSNVSNLFFIGVLLDNLENVNEQDNDLSTISYLPYACIAFGITLPIQTLLHYFFSRPRGSRGYLMALGFTLGIMLLITASVFIILYNYSQCSDWTNLWSYLYCFTFVLEFTLHSILMFVLFAKYSSPSRVSIN